MRALETTVASCRNKTASIRFLGEKIGELVKSALYRARAVAQSDVRPTLSKSVQDIRGTVHVSRSIGSAELVTVLFKPAAAFRSVHGWDSRFWRPISIGGAFLQRYHEALHACYKFYPGAQAAGLNIVRFGFNTFASSRRTLRSQKIMRSRIVLMIEAENEIVLFGGERSYRMLGEGDRHAQMGFSPPNVSTLDGQIPALCRVHQVEKTWPC